MDFQKTDKSYLFERAYQKWGKYGRDVISLSVADMDFRPPPQVQQEVLKWLGEERTPYSHLEGAPELREALAEKIRSVNGIPVDMENILIVPGTMFGIFLVCHLCLNAGDEAVLSPAPVYGPFWQNVKSRGAWAVPHTFNMEDGFPYSPDRLKEAVTDRTRLIMVCNPNNPTGRVLKKSDLEAIAEVACERDLTIFSDELYEDMVFDGKHVSIASLGPEVAKRCFTIFGFSKAYGIPGYRVAYLVAPPHMREKAIHTIDHIIVHTDVLSQGAAMGALKATSSWIEPFRSHLIEMRDRSLERLRKIPKLKCSVPQATPFLFPDIRAFGMSSEEMTKYLEERAKVIVQPGTFFGRVGEGYIRINVATSWDILSEAYDRMEAALSEL